MQAAIVVTGALLLDHCFGEPRRWHPLVFFGQIAGRVERWLRQDTLSCAQLRWLGVCAVTLMVSLVFLLLAPLWLVIERLPGGDTVFDIVIVYSAVATRSLKEHALSVADALQFGSIEQARGQLKRIVSRDVDHTDHSEIASGTCESVLENGSDAIFAALFWYLLAGVPGVLIYRAVNTLDAMWGYKNERFYHFGWAAAKLDDVLNFIPARLVALSYALMGNFQLAIQCWREQAGTWTSPNAGPVIAAGAGSLGIRLGGVAFYQGRTVYKPLLGVDKPASVDDIHRALALIDRTLYCWLVVIFMFGMAHYL